MLLIGITALPPVRRCHVKIFGKEVRPSHRLQRPPPPSPGPDSRAAPIPNF